MAAQWEYCQIAWMARRASDAERLALENDGFEGLIVTEGEVHVAKLGWLSFLGSSQEAEEVVNLGDRMAQLGQDGWELISHVEVTSPTTREVFHFKRVAPTEADSTSSQE